jgi:ferredoxin, 2Fe-2S
MPDITFIAHDGSSKTVEIGLGTSLMRGALINDVDGITAECGGSAMCATCHVYVLPEWSRRLPPPNAVEAEMLESVAAPLRPTSRLSCQIKVTEDLHGMQVELPEFQT